jgi:hypothetical protein
MDSLDRKAAVTFNKTKEHNVLWEKRGTERDIFEK